MEKMVAAWISAVSVKVRDWMWKIFWNQCYRTWHLIKWGHWASEGGLQNDVLVSDLRTWAGNVLFVWDRERQRTNQIQSLCKISSLPFSSFPPFLPFPLPFTLSFHACSFPLFPPLPIFANLESLIKNSCPLKSLCLQWSPKLFWQRKVTLISVLKTNLWVKITTAYHLAKLFPISLNA